MAERQRDGDDILVQICIECGKEFMFDTQPAPDDLTCDKCGNTVFRSFHAHARPSEADVDFHETTDRDTGTTDSATDVTRGDLDDLDNL